MDNFKFNALPDEALIRLGTLLAAGVVPFSGSTLWRKCKAGEFPEPIKASANVTAWRVGDVRKWLSAPESYRNVRV
ncbi:MAG: AlpA family phage regulatory protein [Verrucomicrobia bacterium]|nr:AlpA family phage regulatory protein [Verrucomicrobiota bacterium]